MIPNADNKKVIEISMDFGICRMFHVTVMGQELQQADYRRAVKHFRISGLLLLAGIICLFFMPEEGVHGIAAVFFFLVPIVIVIGFFGFVGGIFQIRKIRKKILCGIQAEITRKTGIFPVGEGYSASFFAKDLYNGCEIEFHTGDINKYQTLHVGDQVTLVDYISAKKRKEYGIA